MRLIDADALLAKVDEEREYLKARGLLGAEHVLTKDFRNLIEDAPTAEMETPVININISKEETQKLLKELQKPYKVVILSESEIEFVKLYGEWTDLSTDGRHTGWIACSVCGQEPPNESNLRTNFCPNCGARMRGAE